MTLRGPEPKSTLQVLYQSADTIRVTPFKEGSVLESTIKTSRTCPFHSRLVAERSREILSILARANAGVPGLLDELVTAGRAIWVDLLPAFLKEKLAEVGGPNLLLHLDQPLVGIPWELLHDGDDFLGRRFRIGRLVSHQDDGAVALHRAMRAPLSALVVGDPAGDLPAARREAEEVGALLEDAPILGRVTVLQRQVTTRALRDALGGHDLLHFAGHVDPGEGLRLADGNWSPRRMGMLRGRVDFPGLVFLNGCASADDTRHLSAGDDPLGAMTGVAGAFLMGGTRHVVGTFWDVRDEVARTFAAGFYGGFGRGFTIGAGMAAGRAALVDAHGEDSLLWADHLLYGDPTWAAAPLPSLDLDDFQVLDGLQARYRVELTADNPSRRLMAGAMLLRLGDRSVLPALERDLTTLTAWLDPDAPRREGRLAQVVVQALATAAGLAPAGPPEQLPDAQAVRALLARLKEGEA